MPPARATRFRLTLWTAAALLAVLGALWALPQSALAAPDRPTGLTATALDHDTVSLTWSHPDEEDVDHYQILRRTSDESRLTQIATTQATSFLDDGLQPETTYTYRVKAVDSEGAASGRSNRSQTTTPKAPSTPAPRQLADPSDATLSALTVNDGTNDLTLVPAFAPGTYVYAVSVGNAVTTVTLTATVNDDGAAVSGVTLGGTAIADSDFTDSITVPSLVVGDNVIVVTVTAEDATTQTYTITVTRATANTAPTFDDGTSTSREFNETIGEATVTIGNRDASRRNGHGHRRHARIHPERHGRRQVRDHYDKRPDSDQEWGKVQLRDRHELFGDGHSRRRQWRVRHDRRDAERHRPGRTAAAPGGTYGKRTVKQQHDLPQGDNDGTGQFRPTANHALQIANPSGRFWLDHPSLQLKLGSEHHRHHKRQTLPRAIPSEE